MSNGFPAETVKGSYVRHDGTRCDALSLRADEARMEFTTGRDWILLGEPELPLRTWMGS